MAGGAVVAGGTTGGTTAWARRTRGRSRRRQPRRGRGGRGRGADGFRHDVPYPPPLDHCVTAARGARTSQLLTTTPRTPGVRCTPCAPRARWSRAAGMMSHAIGHTWVMNQSEPVTIDVFQGHRAGLGFGAAEHRAAGDRARLIARTRHPHRSNPQRRTQDDRAPGGGETRSNPRPQERAAGRSCVRCWGGARRTGPQERTQDDPCGPRCAPGRSQQRAPYRPRTQNVSFGRYTTRKELLRALLGRSVKSAHAVGGYGGEPGHRTKLGGRPAAYSVRMETPITSRPVCRTARSHGITGRVALDHLLTRAAEAGRGGARRRV